MLWTDAFKSRVLFNASKAYIKQLEKGEAWDTIQPVYALSLVNQNFDHQSDSYYHHFKIVTVDEPKLFLDGLEFVFIELPKVKARNLKEKALGVLWLRFLAEIENRAEQISPDFFEVPELMEATEILKESAFTETELASYDKYWDTAMVEKALLQGAKMEGIEEEKFETIYSAFAQGLSIEIISKITRLSVEEVSKALRARNLN
jgi:predicted transposase/invertase (TIGR01784 family)